MINKSYAMKNQNRELHIYIHIPFCVKKCLYCDFLSSSASEWEQERYVKALKKEIEQESRNYKDYLVTTIYFGGGTPSLLPGGWVEEIMDVVCCNYQIAENCEITLEANPGTVSEEKLKAWKRAGINRLSIGMQSADNRELSALGRIHTSRDFFHTYQMATKTGFDNINVDLMAGLPGQGISSLQNTLMTTAGLTPAPAHISVYSLIIEEGTPFYENEPADIPDEDTEREMYKMTGETLSGYGYRQYEISNYAKPGYRCRHNEAYWRRKNYVGFGIGAASLIENVRFRNKPDGETYIKRYLEPEKDTARKSVREKAQKLSIEEQMEEFMFLGLRMTEGISCDEFFRTFGTSINQVYPGIVDELCRKGALQKIKVEKNGDVRISLTRYGIDVSNYVMAEFLF